jgi:hypothetical protein
MAKAGNLMARRSARRTQVAVVMYPGVLPLEVIGTVSALNRLGLNTGFRTVTVAARQEPLATATPLRVVPQSTFAATPHPAALLVPGGSLVSEADENRLLGIMILWPNCSVESHALALVPGLLHNNALESVAFDNGDHGMPGLMGAVHRGDVSVEHGVVRQDVTSQQSRHPSASACVIPRQPLG